MAICCPYCQYSITVKSAKPGRYTPKCPKCSKAFALTVPADGEAEWEAATLASEKAKPTAFHDATEATGGFESPPSNATGRTMADESSVEEEVAETKGAKGALEELEMPEKLGGFEVVRELGRGGMGAVYLARQVSLDRPVALKVMNARWASDPIFLARFTREAYAAAQLVHHNVVQIYDIGEDRGINFFSMEFVEGCSLGDLVKKEGRLDVEAAVGYTLQAARGLKFAHDRGMIHRDVKPDNLMLNLQGIVKVADLGLVKTPEMTRADDSPSKEQPSLNDVAVTRKTRIGLASLPVGMTHAHSAMGSPAFMSPEQCRDAAGVDHRADIYSLGCSFYVLLTGRTPFKGSSAFEVMTKHATQPPVPPDRIVETVPKEISTVVVKMLEKDVDNRYQNMDELIRDLEKWLGVRGTSFRPSEENLNTLEDCVDRYNRSFLAKVRTRIIQAFAGGTAFGSIACLFYNATLSVGLIGLLVQATAAYFIISGLTGRAHLFRKTREVVFGIRLTDWFMLLFGAALFVLLSYMTGLLWAWLGFGAIGVILALGLHLLIDPQVRSQRLAIVAECENTFKRMRLLGCEEEVLRRFAASNSGRHWEAFYEALFGYDAKVAARATLGDEPGNRARYAVWREPLIHWLDRVQLARKENRERQYLQGLEANKLRAEGMGKREAEDRAKAAAAQMVEQAAEIKASENKPVEVNKTRTGDATVAHRKPVNINKMLEAAEKPPKKLPKPPAQPIKRLFKIAFGWKLRFVLGTLLVAGSVLWVEQNMPAVDLPTEGISTDIHNSEEAKKEAGKALGIFKGFLDMNVEWTPLRLNYLPSFLGDIFDHINPLVAGLILLLSICYGSLFRTVLFLVAAVVTLTAQRFDLLPEIGPLQPHHLSMVGGIIIAVLAIVLGRKRGE